MATAVTKYVVIVPHYWGKGVSIAEAWRNVERESCKKRSQLKKGRYVVYKGYDEGDAKMYVDGFGRFMVPKGCTPEVVEENNPSK